MKTNINDEVKLAITQRDLFLKTENYVRKDNMTYVEALVEICKEHDIDPEDLSSFLSGSLKEKLQSEAIDRNIIKSNTAKLF